MMPKRDTIEAIRKLNPTAGADFLAEFSHEELIRYLDRISGLHPAAGSDTGCVEIEPDEPLLDQPPPVPAPQAEISRRFLQSDPPAVHAEPSM